MAWSPLGERFNIEWCLHYIPFIRRKTITSIKLVQGTFYLGP